MLQSYESGLQVLLTPIILSLNHRIGSDSYWQSHSSLLNGRQQQLARPTLAVKLLELGNRHAPAVRFQILMKPGSQQAPMNEKWLD